MNFEIEKYNQYNLPEGRRYSTCPLCSEHRKKSKEKCMMLDWKTGLGTCQHCDEVIQLHTYKNKRTDSESNRLKHKRSTKKIEKAISFISPKTVKDSMQCYDINNFVTFLNRLFSHETTLTLIERYCIGTSKKWPGATVFWLKDLENRARTGKVMLYNPTTGKRVKEERKSYFTWVHSALNLTNFNYKQCLFGEHLLKSHKNKPIALVESEKTAIIASAYLPKFTWLATSGMQNFSAEKCKVLKGKTIVLYPDLNAVEDWTIKAAEIEKSINVKFLVSDLLQKHASEEEITKGLDLADFLVRHKWQEETEPISEEQKRLSALTAKNPNLSLLIKKLDLVIID
ncbi:DUF6371 domain-containing protein [Saccharicrinis aurantiacus]|uniref:DUF6371 domain-containing protein n=1 Tax=Saccharicrinis aurantiacus TaxID=1849719 RepID=UPI0008382088|nr:DUF6371 domain-containing protein [Saccharicrinis aurantiacus]